MRQINIHQAKTHLSRLVDQAVRGEGFVIAKAGKPLVKVTALQADELTPNPLGFMAGEFEVPDDFDTMMEDDIAVMFAAGNSSNNDIEDS